MDQRHHYNQAPITEAIIDIRTRLPQFVDLKQIESFHDRVSMDYPRKSVRNLAQANSKMGEQLAASAVQNPIGYLFRSEDSKQIVQARLDGFTLSRLAPYGRWEDFCSEAVRLWNVYREQFQPEEILRLAVRYINRIDLPHPVDDLSHFFNTYPEVSQELPQALSGLLMQLTIPQPDLESIALLNQALIEPKQPNKVSMIFDIDLFRQDNVPQADQEVWSFFEQLHKRKNEIFEACITDKTRELFA